YRWYDSQGIAPLFPFGYGLSYTTFGFSNLKLSSTSTGAAVTFTVKNTGKRPGADVAQVYVSDPAVAGEPPRQLKGYKRISLAPGKSSTVTIPLDQRSFAYWSSDSQAWTVAAGCYTISVGDSSRSLPLTGQVGISAS